MDIKKLQPDKILDCSGLTCPRPVIETSKAIKDIAVGQLLQVIATDPGSPPDMEAWSQQTGHPIIEFIHEGKEYIFYIMRAN